MLHRLERPERNDSKHLAVLQAAIGDVLIEAARQGYSVPVTRNNFGRVTKAHGPMVAAAI